VSKAVAALGISLLLAVACGCGGESSATPTEPEPASTTTVQKPPPAKQVPRVPCPPDLVGCRSARGTIIYVERVDPDGDGDAHFVLASRDSVTLPGISVIDVAVDLRPHPLPGPGDQLAAAGQVQTGSYGQSQIHAVALRTADRP
jgi:hypothetical protein